MSKDQKSDLENGRLIRARQRAIGRELRRMYDNVAKEPVPDEFLNLLHKIDETGSEGGKKES
ncbi:MAG TPA: NepR family anti-sigma factor [Rhizomicrobium sp.]